LRMTLAGKRIGFAITGSFCTFEQVVKPMQEFINRGAVIHPIMSQAAYNTDTRFGTAAHWRHVFQSIADNDIIHEITQAEPIGPQQLLDLVIVAPCTGNSLAKLANAITDTPVIMACKSHLRNGRPVLLAISTNDGLGLNAKNLGTLLAARNIYFVPFGQDNPSGKPTSLVADMNLLPAAAECALAGRQIQPVLISYTS
jgi:dipicolinate synthase subunit B